MTRVIGAGVLLVSGQRILAISRGLDRANLGLPGGHVDPSDANARHAAGRELSEETGVQVYAPRLRYLASNRAHKGGTFVVFLAQEIVSWPSVLRSVPFEGFVGWHHPDDLLRPGVTYRDFHRRLFTKIGL